jgi:type II secretory pathway pseudopilin PulG
MKTKAKKPAFSLIELIIYVAITSTIVVAMLSFSISILQVRGDAEFSREVFENARYVGDALSRSIRDAEDITSVTEAHPGEIVTDSDGALVLTINTATKTVGTQTIRYLRIQDPSGWDQITSDKVNVTNFSKRLGTEKHSVFYNYRIS